MNLYSRALRHVDMKRVKELYEEKLEREKVAKLLEDIRREELLNLNSPEFSNWRFDLYEQGMTSSEMQYQTNLPATGNAELILVNTDSEGYPTSDNDGNVIGSGSGNGYTGGFTAEDGSMISIGGETAWNSSADTVAIDLSKVDTVSVTGLAGNNFNGGMQPVNSLYVYFYFADYSDVSDVFLVVDKSSGSLTNVDVEIPERFRAPNVRLSFWTETVESGTYDMGIHFKPFTIAVSGLDHATIGTIPIGAGSATGVHDRISYYIRQSSPNFRDMGYYFWYNIQLAKNGSSVGPNPNYGEPGEPEYIWLDNWDPAPVSGSRRPSVLSGGITDEDYEFVGRAIYNQFNGTKLYGINRVSFKRKAPMSVFVNLTDPDAQSFIYTDPLGIFTGLSAEERIKKLKEMLDAGDEYIQALFGDEFPGTGIRPGPGPDQPTWTGETPDSLSGQAGVDHITDTIGLAVSGIAGVVLAKAGLGAAVNKLTLDLTSKFVKSGVDLNKWINKGKNERIPNEDSASWFELVVDDLQQTGKFDGGKGGIIPKNMQQLKDLFTGDGGITWSFSKGIGTGPTPIQRQLMRRGEGFIEFMNQLSGKNDVKEQTEPKYKNTLKNPKDFFKKKDIKPVFPEMPPPKSMNGYHPDLITPEGDKKKSDRYNRLDPMSAKAMPPTGNPFIDKKAKAAAKKPKV